MRIHHTYRISEISIITTGQSLASRSIHIRTLSPVVNLSAAAAAVQMYQILLVLFKLIDELT